MKSPASAFKLQALIYLSYVMSTISSKYLGYDVKPRGCSIILEYLDIGDSTRFS